MLERHIPHILIAELIEFGLRDSRQTETPAGVYTFMTFSLANTVQSNVQLNM